MLKVATLFSGIGAPEMALIKEGISHRVILACEIDKFARKSYWAIYRKEPEYTDIHEVSFHHYRGVIDLLIGGSPCQSYSIAGRREGVDDPRGALIYQFYRAIDEARPRAFIFENVKNFTTIDGGATFESFKNDLRALGYDIHARVLNAKHYGLPQNRERIFIVGVPRGAEFRFPGQVPLTVRMEELLEEDVGPEWDLGEKALKYMNRKVSGGRTHWDFTHHHDTSRPTAATIPSVIYKGVPYNVLIMRPRGNNQGGIRALDGICPTVTSGGSFQNNFFFDNGARIRKLTPKEVWRLMGFPDWAFEAAQAAGVSNTQLYKQAGNSMAVPVMRALVRQIHKGV